MRDANERSMLPAQAQRPGVTGFRVFGEPFEAATERKVQVHAFQSIARRDAVDLFRWIVITPRARVFAFLDMSPR